LSSPWLLVSIDSSSIYLFFTLTLPSPSREREGVFFKRGCAPLKLPAVLVFSGYAPPKLSASLYCHCEATRRRPWQSHLLNPIFSPSPLPSRERRLGFSKRGCAPLKLPAWAFF
jgi:hypothetical protein